MRHPRTILALLSVVVFALSLTAVVCGKSAPSAMAAASGQEVEQQVDPVRRQQQQEDYDPFRAQRLITMNKRRHAELKKDTDKLLELATELKLQVDKSNEHTLSVDVVRKAEEIEKLARSVKEKMRGM